MKTGESRLRAKYLPLGFQIGQICRSDNPHELLGTFDVMHHEVRCVGGVTGCRGLGGRVEDNAGTRRFDRLKVPIELFRRP